MAQAGDPVDLLLRHAYIITMDGQRRIFTDGAVAIAAPDGSATVPVNVPFCTCAAAPSTKTSKEK